MADGERRLAAIMFTDLVGFTSLGQKDESLALSVLDSQRTLMRPIFKRHGGREVKTIGDAFLVDFPSALNAVKCAYEIQTTSWNANKSLPESRRIHLRIGIHLGDIIDSQGDISGDAVNVASRIEPLSESNGVCITRQVYDQIKNKVDIPVTTLGFKSLKNISAPMEVYKMSMPWDSRKTSLLGENDTQRIAILPFANVSPDPSDEYFSDGMTDELISVLSKIRGLRVVARTSVMRFKGEKITVNRIGEELRVSSVVEGSVRKSKGRVRITVQLVDTRSEEQLWAETYDRDLEDVLAVQTNIAQQVAKALEVRLGVREHSALQSQQTQNPRAYAFYLKGRFHWNSRAETEVNRAIKYFEEAVAIDPEYALAYVGLADSYSVFGFYGYRRPSIAFPQAKALAEKALSLDDGLAEAHASVGSPLMQYYFDWQRAGAELDRALELNPSYATAHMWRATHHAATGKFDDSVAEAKKAVELDPLSMIILTDSAKDLYLAKRYDESIEQYQKALAVDSSFPIAHKGLAEVLAQKGMNDEAVDEIERAIELSKRSVFILDDLGYVYAKAARGKDAMRVLDDLERISADEFVPAYGRAIIYAALGETEKALTWLERAYEERSFLIYLKSDPALDSLRREERFKEILNKMGL